MGEIALADTVRNNIIGNVLGGLISLVEFRFACRSENVGIVGCFFLYFCRFFTSSFQRTSTIEYEESRNSRVSGKGQDH